MSRPIAIGVQGLADVLAMMRLPWETTVLVNGKSRTVPHPKTRALQYHIYETIYHAFNVASIGLARKYGTYPLYEGSPLSQGKLRFDMVREQTGIPLMYDWYATVRVPLAKYGRRNSLGVEVVAATTTDGINPHMVRELVAHGLLDAELREQIEAQNGSIAGLLPDEYKWIENLFSPACEQVHAQLQHERGYFEEAAED